AALPVGAGQASGPQEAGRPAPPHPARRAAREAAPGAAGGPGRPGEDPGPRPGRRARAGRGAAVAGGGLMSVLVLVEHDDGAPDELSLQALAFARTLGGPLHALLVDAEEAAGEVAVETAHVADIDGSYAPGAWAAAVSQLVDELSPAAVVAAGS